MIKPIFNAKSSIHPAIKEIAKRNKTTIDMAQIIAKNNQKLCNDINNLYGDTNGVKFKLDFNGNFIKTSKIDNITKKVSYDELRLYIEKIGSSKN